MNAQTKIGAADFSAEPRMRTDAEYRERAKAVLTHIPPEHLENCIKAHVAVEKAFDRQRVWRAQFQVADVVLVVRVGKGVAA